MAKARRGRGSKASQQPVPKKRAASPDTSDTDPELIDSSEPRWEPLKIRDHYFGTERQMTASQQLMGSIEDDFAEDTLQFLTKWKDTPTERWSHDRHDTWEPVDAFLESSNAVIKYLDRNPELEDHPQMSRFKMKRDERRERRISHIQKEKAGKEKKEEEEPEAPQSDEEDSAVAAKSRKKGKAAIKSSKTKAKQPRSPSPEEEAEAAADADEESDSALPAAIDITKPAQPSPAKGVDKKLKPKAVAGNNGASSKALSKGRESTELAADSEAEQEEERAEDTTPAPDAGDDDEAAAAAENNDEDDVDQAEGGAQPNDPSDDDADFNLFDLAPQNQLSAPSSPAPASSPAVAAPKSGARKEKRKAETQSLFRDAGSSDNEEEHQQQPAKKTKLTAAQADEDEEGGPVPTITAAALSAESVAEPSPPASLKKDANGTPPSAPATEKERKQHLQKVVASNYMRSNKDTAARKPTPESKDIHTYTQPLGDDGAPVPNAETDAVLQALADTLVNNKTPFVGDKNVRSHAKVVKMVTRFWGVRKRFKPLGEEAESPSTQQAAGAPPYLQKHLTGKKAAIFSLKRAVPDQKNFDNDIAALQLLALSYGAVEVGPLTSAMAENPSDVAIVFIHCTSLYRAGDMERLVEDQLLNRLRTASPDVRFVVVGTKYSGLAGKESVPVFEPIFETRVAVTFTSDLVLHQNEEWRERANKCHEMWPTVQMWMHGGEQSKSAELTDGGSVTMTEATGQFFSIKYINSSLDKALSAGLGATLEESQASHFPAEEDVHENDEPPERALKQHEEAREVVKLAHALRIKYFKVRRWIVVGSPLELTKFNSDHKEDAVIEFVDLKGLDAILKEVDEGEEGAPFDGDMSMGADS